MRGPSKGSSSGRLPNGGEKYSMVIKCPGLSVREIWNQILIFYLFSLCLFNLSRPPFPQLFYPAEE